MTAAGHHVLLVLSVAALASAGWRVSGVITPVGLERLVVTTVLFAAGAAGEAIVLGFVGLGTSPVALPIAAGLTWLAAHHWFPARTAGTRSELTTWWLARRAAERASLGALAGAGVAWAVWQLRYPALGLDTVQYHLPEIVLWAQLGSPGSIEPVLPGLPVGNYPLTNEVILAWGVGISRSFVLVTLWPWVTLALTAAAGWLGLRSLGVSRPAAAAAGGAVCASPHLLAWQSTGGMTDPAALAWLVACAALCRAAVARPTLLAPALIAGALSVGTKTTTVPLVALTLGMTLWTLRSQLGAVRAPLVLASGTALLVGGGWYLRNLVEHGSPFWPYLAAPWGDPVPPLVQALDATILDSPAATIRRLGHLYLDRFGGGLVLLAGGLLVPLVVRTRAALAAGLATGVGLLLWALAPVTTGVANATVPEEAVFSTTRYALPILGSGALAVALSARAGRRAAWLATSLLSAAAVLGVSQTLKLGFPVAPTLLTAVGGAAAGALLAAFATAVLRTRVRRHRLSLSLRARRVSVVGVAIVLGALLSVPAVGYVTRHARTRAVAAAGVTQWLADQPGFSDGRQPVEMTIPIGLAAGDRLVHPLVLLAPNQTCAQALDRAAGGWLILFGPLIPGDPWAETRRCVSALRPAYRDAFFTGYPVPRRRP